MPYKRGIFRQQRQTYDTKSIVHLYEPYDPKMAETVSNDRVSINARDFTEIIKNEKRINYSNYRRSLSLYSRRKKRRLLKSLQECLISDQSTSEGTRRPRKPPRRLKSKISQCTSTAVLVDSYCSGSDDNARKSHQFTSTDDSSNFSKLDSVVSSAMDLHHRKQVQTCVSLASENIQATGSFRNISVMVVPPRNAVEKETQKSEKMIVRTMEERGTDMVEYYTPADLYCIEWMHRNLLEINLNPYRIVEDERIKEASEITCYTSRFSM